MTNTNDIELLFARIAEDPTQIQPPDIDKVIAYYREQRASKASGIKPKKDKGPGLKVDLAKLGLPTVASQAAPVGFKRRV